MDEQAQTNEEADVQGSITQLLEAWGKGNEQALSEMFPLVYSYLRRIAGAILRHRKNGTVLQPTVMVHEAYLRLSSGDKLSFRNRKEFYSFSGRLMRFILVEYIRYAKARKRQGGAEDEGAQFYSDLEIDQIELSNGGSLDQEQVLSLDTALRKLEKMDERAARVIELKFFAGMNYDEIAEVLTISPATVKRELGSAKCFLYQELKMSQLR